MRAPSVYQFCSAISLLPMLCSAILLSAFTVAADEPVQYTIDYAVFYTPEALANEEGGSVPAMEARINRAFDGANEIFRESKTGVQLRLVAVRKLSINNSDTTLDTVISELSPLAEVIDTIRQSGADSYAFIVERMAPGAYAGIPTSSSQARRGGSTFFGRRNFSGFTFAHETGHTLGAFHDRPAGLSTSLELSPDNPYGNHFIGASGQHWRTVMSVKLDSYVAPQGTVIPTVQCNRFSSPDVIWDGVPTGVTGVRDVVSAIRFYAPLVSQAGELRNQPPNNGGGEEGGNSENPPENGPPAVPTPGEGEEESDTEEPLPSLSIHGRPTRSGNTITVKARCRFADNTPASGKRVTLTLRNKGKVKTVKNGTCPADGVIRLSVRKTFYQRGLEVSYRSHPEIKIRVPFIKSILR